MTKKIELHSFKRVAKEDAMLSHIENITKNPPARKALEGRTVVRVRYQTDAELLTFNWTCRALVLEFDDGSHVVLSCDDAGNGPGAMFYFNGRERDTFGSIMKVELENG